MAYISIASLLLSLIVVKMGLSAQYAGSSEAFLQEYLYLCRL